jgi:hypothetical protein
MRISTVTVPLAAVLVVGIGLPAVALSDDCPTCGTVSVSVAGRNGEAIRGGAYVALVAKGDSFLRPVAEMVRETTAPAAVWQVQPGTYVAACFARGFSPSLSSAVEVRSGKTTPILFTVTPMLTLTGRVLSKETGKPIEGATLMPSVFSTPKFTTKWSDLAQRYVRSAYGAVTGRQGEFSIFVAPKSSNAFVFEAPGAASTLVNNVMISETPRQLPDVILEQAGALQVIGSFPASADPEKCIVTIYSFTYQGFEFAEAEPFQRRLGPDGTVEWRTLHPGYWAVRFNAEDGRPLSLGSVRVTPGGVASFQFNIVAARLVGVVKAVPSELIGSAKVMLNAGYGTIETELVPSAKKGEENTGSFEARLWQPGVYSVGLSYGGSLERSGVFLGRVSVKGGAKGTIEQTFEMHTRELAGLVLSGEGEPIEGAEVLVGTDEHGLSFEVQACQAKSDASGAWRCRWLPEGKLLVVARKEGVGASGIEAVEAGVGATVTLRLTAHANVSGELAVPEGADPTEAPVGFSCEAFPALLVQGRTGRGGAFALTDLPRCDGQLIVRPKDKALAFVFREVTAGPPTDLGALKAEPAGAVFAVGSMEPDAKGNLGKRLYYRGTQFCTKLFGGIGGVGTGYPEFPGAPGYFYKLPPGPYYIEWLDLDRKVVARSVAFEVVAGEMREVSFTAR